MRSLFRSRARGAIAPVEPVPTVFPKITGADIAAVFAGRRIAGDFYDSIRANSHRVLFALLDVAGRRNDNRKILTAAQKIFREFGAELFSRPDINESEAMSELCLSINRRLIEVSCGVRSCPAFIACYHEELGTLCYTNAGHTPGLLRDSSGIIELTSTGLPLGLFSHGTCDAPTVGLDRGAALLLVSRGLIECEGNKRAGEEDPFEGEFGLGRVKQLLQTSSFSGAQALCVSIVEAASKFSAGTPLCDDRTALALLQTA